MEFSPALATAIRDRVGLNRVEAARVVGLSRQGLVNIEDGVSVPGVDTLGRMASAYGASADDFFIDADAIGMGENAPLMTTSPAPHAATR